MRSLSAVALFSLTAAAALLAPTSLSAAPLIAYDDALQDGFQDWSWAPHSLVAIAPVRAGVNSISCTYTGWDAVYLHRDAGVDVATYEALTFSIHGGVTGGQRLQLVFIASGATIATVDLAPYLPGGVAPAGAWVDIRIVFDNVGLAGQVFDGFYFSDVTGGAQPTLYLDEISISERVVGPPPPITVTVDPALDRRPISPLIYGVNFGDPADPTEPGYPLRRWGGNSTTRYSWEDDVHNTGADWFFCNYTNGPDPGTLPNDSSADVFIAGTRAEGAEVILTVPTIGWTPVDRVRRWGFSVAKYGAQQDDECRRAGFPPWCEPDMGNGVDTGGANITGNDPLDTSRPIDQTFAGRWITHVVSREGGAASGGVRYVALDNEPMLWSSSHRDVHPQKLGYAELWQRTIDHARAVKASDPAAQVLGPDSWGWCDYFWSDADGCGNSSGADYVANGPLIEWYLRQVRAEELASGTRPVDVLDLHYYPQSQDVALSDDEDAVTSALRLRSTRSLWDAAYVDESWVGAPVWLIPRMKELIAANCPGMPLAITEYSWGNDDGLSSALAQVDVLGLFGREGVDIATRWVSPAAGSIVEDAFRLYLDYDRLGARVEGDSVRAVSSELAAVASFGVRRADDRLYVVLVNKDTRPRDVGVQFTSTVDPVQLFGFDATTRLAALGTFGSTRGFLSVAMPARSARLLVTQLPCALPGEAGLLMATKASAGAAIHFTWSDAVGATGHVLRTDLLPNGAFTSSAGSAVSGAAGLDVAMPPESLRFYLLHGQNPCGEGP